MNSTIPLKYFGTLLWQYLRPLWLKMIILGIVLLSGIAFQLIAPQIIRHFIDTVKAGETTQSIIRIAALFLSVELVRELLKLGTVYFSTDVGYRATDRMREDVIEHCLRLDMPFHHARSPGEFIARIHGDIGLLNTFFSQFIINILGSFLLLTGIVVMFFREDVTAGLAVIGFVAISAFLFTRFRETESGYWRKLFASSAALTAYQEEQFSCLEEMRALNGQAYVMRGLYQQMQAVYRQFTRTRIVNECISRITNLPLIFASSFALAIGAYLYQADAVTIGTVYLFLHYTEMILEPLRQMSQELGSLRMVTAGIQRVGELLQTQSALVDGNHMDQIEGSAAISFNDVSFRYGQQDDVLQDISFSLAPSTTLGLLGRTGSGKTTITRLLFRFYDPVDGAISINDRDVRTFRLDHLRRHVGLVTQDVQLFHGTLRDNLSFFDASISETQILHGLDALGLMDWYTNLSSGLDTEIVSGGQNLSAGEAQLIAFTRIFLKNPGLVILDEASARLDPVTEHLLEGALETLLKDRTAVIIAHRLQTVLRADELLILDNGRIQEWGKREALSRDPASRFSQLLKTGMEDLLA